MKKIISLMLVLAMTVVMLTSCGSNLNINIKADGSGTFATTMVFDLSILEEQGLSEEDIIQSLAQEEDSDYEVSVENGELVMTLTAPFGSDDELLETLKDLGYSNVYASEHGRYIRYTTSVDETTASFFGSADLSEIVPAEKQDAVKFVTTITLPYPITKTSDNMVIDQANPCKATLTQTLDNAFEPIEVMVSTLAPFEDRKVPSILGVKEGKTYSDPVDIVATDLSGIKSATYSLNGADPVDFGFAKTIKLNGQYAIVVKDYFGNQSSLNFTFNDTVSPLIELVDDGAYYNSDVYVYFSDNVELDKVTVNGNAAYDDGEEIYQYAEMGSADILKSGKYTIVATDINGNSSKVSFVVDKLKPIVKGVRANKTYARSVTIKPVDKYGIQYAKVNGKSFKSGITLKKNGTYKVVVKDKAGNVKKFSFKIQK